MINAPLIQFRRDGQLRHNGHRTATVIAATVATVVAYGSYAVDGDGRADLRPVSRWFTSSFSAVAWPVMAALVAVSAFHYLAAAVAARAVAGVRLPWGELVMAQLAASAANRVTPAGLGGGGVLARYMARRGGLEPAQAIAAVTALAVLGAIADVIAFVLLVGAGAIFGLAGAATEVPLLLSRIVALVPFGHPTGTVLALVGALLVIGVLILVRLPRSTTERVAKALQSFVRAVRDLAHHPGRIAALMGASAGTTLILAVGFALAAVAGPASLAMVDFGALMIGYMVASAASNALPTPGGIGTADAALVGVLLAAGASAGPALATVLAFRLVTFWAPAASGIGFAHILRRRGAL